MRTLIFFLALTTACTGSFASQTEDSCSLILEVPHFNDIDQRDPALTDLLNLDGVQRSTMAESGLCGPVCVANILAETMKTAPSRSLIVKEVVESGLDELNIPHPRIFLGLMSWELGRLIKHQLKKLNIESKIDYLGEPIPSLDPEDYDVPLPPYAEVRPPVNIRIEDLKTANAKKTFLIAMVGINHNTPHEEVTRLSGLRHFVIIQKVVEDPKTGQSYALIRDPELKRPYWKKLKHFQNGNLKVSTIELAPVISGGNDTETSDKTEEHAYILPILTLIRVRF